MSAESRYYYVDAQNQAAGPIAMAGLLALKTAGTVTDATLVVAEGGAEWVAFSTLKPAAPTPAPLTAPASTPQPTASPTAASHSPAATSPSSSSAAEPPWVSHISQKVDRMVATMERLIVSLEKSRASVPAPAPATAALHAEKINLNATPKPGIAAPPSSSPGVVPPPHHLPGGASPRPGLSKPLTPLAVPANAQKSALPLPALGKTPGPAPAGVTPAASPAKGNIFSKFLKK